MKKKKKTTSKPSPKNPQILKPKPPFQSDRTPLLERINHWSGKNKFWVIGTLVVFWIVIRVSLFNTVANSSLYHLYKWQESDSFFFDEQARSLAAGDWLNRKPLHPYHGWHQEFAEYYFKQHPDKLNQILAANPGRDSTFVPGKVLWNEWYGGNTYHQEPFYAYTLAFLYTLTGNGIYWMMVLQALIGIISGVLLWLISRRFFGDTVAMSTGLLYAFCGTVLFQEALILRTSWSVFFTLLSIWVFQRALDQRTKSAFFVSGITIGLAFLLQSFFILFLLGALTIYLTQERKISKISVRNTGLVVGGFALIFMPVILRNTTVGAPLFSTSSIGAITFVATNTQHTNAISRWQPEAAKYAEIMGKTNGKFMPAAFQTIQTHDVGSYLHLVWSKFKSTLNGQEWPNNENYYFYKATVPILRWTFIDFYWIAGLGIAGILFALYYRKKCSTLYLGILLHLAIMIGFYVLGRLRAPLAVLMLPFAAYCLIECLRFAQVTRKVALTKIAVAALCIFLFSYQFYRQRVNMLDLADYNVLYELVYFDRVKSSAEARQMNEAISVHNDFLKYQPDFITRIRPNQILKSPPEVELLSYFANHHQIHSYLYEDSGNKIMAAKEMEKYNMMKNIVENSRRNLAR